MHNSNIRLITLLNNVPYDRIISIYKRHNVDPDNGIYKLIEKICLDGSNTIVSFLKKGEGVDYFTIIKDVAKLLKVEFKNDSKKVKEEDVELIILEYMINEYLKTASDKEKQQIYKIIDESGIDSKDMSKIFSGNKLTDGAIKIIFKNLGGKIASEVIKNITLRIVRNRIIGYAGEQSGELIGLAVPLLNIVMIGWTLFDISGPAFRKTVPTVLEIALLRVEFAQNYLE